MNYADQIKSVLTARDIFPIYGFEINRAGFCHSPFAPDKTPSCKVYDGQRGWHDFSTGKGGDIIAFVMQYFGLSFMDAQKKLNDDFHLGLPIGERLSKADREKVRQESEKRAKIIAERKNALERLSAAYDSALTEYAETDKALMENAPELHGGAINNAFARALHLIDAAFYNLCQAQADLCEFEKNAY